MVSTGSATRAFKPGWQESDRANPAQRARATGAHGDETQMAGTAGQAAASEPPTEGPIQKTPNGLQTSVRSSMAENAGGECARGDETPRRKASGGGRLRSASATLRPPSVPHHQRLGKTNTNQG